VNIINAYTFILGSVHFSSLIPRSWFRVCDQQVTLSSLYTSQQSDRRLLFQPVIWNQLLVSYHDLITGDC